MNNSLNQYVQKQQLSPFSMEYFQELNNQVSQMYVFCYERNFQVKHIDHFQQERQKKFVKSMKQYKSYLQKERKGLQRNTEHCKLRNQWYREQIKKSWQMAVSNRPLVLRSLARTNILKRDADEWLARIDDDVLADIQNQAYSSSQQGNTLREHIGKSLGPQADLKGSKLIDKYNQILNQYYHKV